MKLATAVWALLPALWSCAAGAIEPPAHIPADVGRILRAVPSLDLAPLQYAQIPDEARRAIERAAQAYGDQHAVWLSHIDPRVRGLFVFIYGQNHRRLPDVARLLGDQSPSIPRSQLVGLYAEQQVPSYPQTVGDMARTMIRGWTGLEYRDHASFREDWDTTRGMHSWSHVWAERLLRARPPESDEFKAVLTELSRQDSGTQLRCWLLVQTYVRELAHHRASALVRNALDRETMLGFLRGTLRTGDPFYDAKGSSNWPYMHIKCAVLKYGTRKLHRQDAEEFVRLFSNDGWRRPEWLVAAAELKPEGAETVLKAGYAAVSNDISKSLLLAHCALVGGKDVEFLRDEFYRHATPRFGLGGFQAAVVRHIADRDGTTLLNTTKLLLEDERSRDLSWFMTRLLVEKNGDVLGYEVVDRQELSSLSHPLPTHKYHGRHPLALRHPNKTAEVERTIAGWRKALLRALQEMNQGDARGNTNSTEEEGMLPSAPELTRKLPRTTEAERRDHSKGPLGVGGGSQKPSPERLGQGEAEPAPAERNVGLTLPGVWAFFAACAAGAAAICTWVLIRRRTS